MVKKAKSNIMWGARFYNAPDHIMKSINASINFDRRLYKHDISASIIHAEMLVKNEIISEQTGIKIVDGLQTILQEIESNNFDFKVDLEDIHMNIEARLYELIGEEAGFLHTARSRNDQVSTDFRLWTRDAVDELIQQLENLMKAFLKKAEAHVDTIMPGFTHLQVAQPTTFGHHLLAYLEMLSRDINRFQSTRLRLNECPLGAAALAGTSFAINRIDTSTRLGFDRPMSNSIDAVSDRDFCLDFLSTCAICATHLSRFAEELVIWTSTQFNFVSLSDKFSTGSSIMPQKRNPDAAELIRGKVGRVTGSLVGLLSVLKGLPLAYSKDLQEDKECVFDAFDTMSLCLIAMTGMVSDLKPNEKILRDAAKDGFSTATDLADWLVRELGIPFRESHNITGRIVKLAEKNKCKLIDLDLESLQTIEENISSKIFSVLTVEASVASRDSFGGTSPSQVRIQISKWKKRLF
ncbi:MAG: argininosuccinate lyase [Paracoccaceae bacterium]|nr:argininosuccinate lyase [Paracoccaceae bacterium]